MPINFTCPTCSKKYNVADALAGKKVQCKACKGPMTVPNAARPAVAAPAAAPATTYFEPFPDISLPPLEAEAAAPSTAPADAPRATAGAPCPKCRRLTAPNAVICTNCGQNLRTGKAIKTVRASNKSPSSFAPATLLKSPLLYVALSFIVAAIISLFFPALLGAISTAIIVVGVAFAIIGNLIFGLAMWRAVFEDHGFIPFLGLFIPVVNVFVHIWMIITYWAYAKKALICSLIGFGIVVFGAVAPRMIFLGHAMKSIASIRQAMTSGISAPDFPALPTLTRLDGDIDTATVHIGGSGPGTDMKIVLYLPSSRNHEPHSLPCVLIAPAGTSMLTGVALSSDDRKEHLSYVRSGFAVAAFDLDGDLSNHEDVRAFAAALQKFRDARYGLANAHTTIDFLLQRVPDVDPERLYAVGHSSAGGFALNLAADEPRIKGVVAYAPSTDILRAQPAQLFSVLSKVVPDVKAFAKEASPITHVGEIDCPVLLFRANDDNVIPSAEFDAFATGLRNSGNTPIVVTTAAGGHYDAMISKGIPAGVAWLSRLGGANAPVAQIPTPSPTPAPSRRGAIPTSPPQQRPVAIESPQPPPTPLPTPAANAEPTPSPIAATPAAPVRPAPVVPADPRVFIDPETAAKHYTITPPEGYKPLAGPAMGLRRWSGPGRSSFAVTIRHSPVPAAPPPSDKTITAGNITFFQTRTTTSATAITTDYAARDGDYYIIVNTTADIGDRAASRVLPEAIAKIRVADDAAK